MDDTTDQPLVERHSQTCGMTKCSIPVVAKVMLAVLTPLNYGLKLWWVKIIPPVKVEVRLRIL